MNIRKRIPAVTRLLEDKNYSTKIEMYFSTQTIGEDYDPYEAKATYSNLNPLTIRGYVREVSPEALVYKQYGLTELGAKEILCEKRYAPWFRRVNLIKIDGDEFIVYKTGNGTASLISNLPFNLIKVVVRKK